jgi:hypothetical protein
MYFHGLESLGHQVTRVAVCSDGLQFGALPEILGPPYFRVFAHDGWSYAIAMPGHVLRSRDGRHGFEQGPTLFEPSMRHSAVRRRGSTLDVFWTRVGDAPERILLSTIDLRAEWTSWRETAPVEILRPERQWEGAGEPVVASIRGVARGRLNQLRDPAIFEEGGRTYLLYAVAGESGIAIAELVE